jgi:hypothetical protein
MSKLVRNLSSEESRRWWASAEKVAAEVETWPASRRAGINVSGPPTDHVLVLRLEART